jgi:carboxymethylenebutenolidase
MHMTRLDVPTPDGVADAFLVRPDGDGPFAAVIMYMDAFGLRPRLEEMAGRIAERGYAVLVPNLLYRGGRAPQFDLAGLSDPARRGEVFDQVMPLVGALDNAAITRDAGAYLDFLAAQDGVAPGSVVLVGCCMGGTNALRTIEAYPNRVAGVASFHGGRIVTDRPDSPHRRVGAVTGELYFAHADNDRSMTPEQIRTLEAALDAAGVRYRSEVYEGAGHGFTMADTAAYDEAAEKRHWENLFGFLNRVLPGRPGVS